MEKLKEELKQYPSSFDVTENMLIKEEIRIMKDKLLLEIEAENEYDTDMEKHRTWNLISFSCFQLGDLTEAYKFNHKVLDSDSKNIIALSNKAWFIAIEDLDKIKDCKDIIELLKELGKDRTAILKANAEIAFTCSRLGIRAYGKARDLFKKVIEDCNDILKTTLVLPVECLCIWIFGYALIRRRQMHFNNQIDEDALNSTRDDNKHLVELYCRIIRLKGQSTCLKRYKARSYVDLGFLAFNIKKEYNKTTYPDGIYGIFPEDQIKETDDFFEEAFCIFSNDVYVLESCGNYFRCRGDIDRSINLLKKAVGIKGSSIGYHHLGLALKSQLDTELGIRRHTIRGSNGKQNIKFTVKETQGARQILKSNMSVQPKSLLSLLKNPRNPKHINYEKNKDRIAKILECYERACTVSFNTAAMFDEGLLYRQVWEFKKALEVFETLVKNRNGHCSPVELAKAYEQAAFCIYDLLRKEEVGDKVKEETMLFKMKTYLKSSLEITCKNTAKIPFQKELWNSAPTLKTLLSGEASTKEDKQDLLFLHRKMDNYKDAIGVLDELEKLAESDEEKAEVIQEKVKDYLNLGNFDDAVIALDLIACLPDGNQMVENTLYRQVQIEAGVDGLRRGHAEIARQRIKNAFDDSSRNETSPGDDGDVLKEEYDLFILCNPDDDDNGIKLMNIMNKTGLYTTVNVDSKLPGTPVLAGMRDVMNQSKQFVIMFDFDCETADYAIKSQMQVFTDMLLQTVQQKSVKAVTLVMMESSAEVPDNILHLPYKRIVMDLCAENILDDKDFFQNENILNGVKNILLSLAAVI